MLWFSPTYFDNKWIVALFLFVNHLFRNVNEISNRGAKTLRTFWFKFWNWNERTKKLSLTSLRIRIFSNELRVETASVERVFFSCEELLKFCSKLLYCIFLLNKMFNLFLDIMESAESCLNFIFYLSADSDDQRYMLTVFERWQMSLSARFTPGARWKTIIYRWDMGEASCASRF